jgi:hypothetical protein
MALFSLRSLLTTALLASAFSLSGCGWIAGGYNQVKGRPVAGEYKGLDNRSAVIVVYVPDSIVNDYPQAALEITEFFRVELLKGVPTVRLVSTQRVIDWQRNIDWIKLSDNEIGRHFGTDRVIRIELVNYQTKEPGIQGYVKGRINTNVRVTETGAGDSGKIVWERRGVTAEWPTDSHLEMLRVNETLARQRTLAAYGLTLAQVFYDHQEVTPSMIERRSPRD